MPTTESLPDFLHRVHVEDVAQGRGMHRQGTCAVCDAEYEKQETT